MSVSSSVTGWGFFNRHYGDFCTGADKESAKALSTIGTPAAIQGLADGLRSTASEARKAAARHLPETNATRFLGDLWDSYRMERDIGTASIMAQVAQALLTLGFRDEGAVGFLIQRLNPKSNPNWYSDVALLRQITGESIGPDSKDVEKKQRDRELRKWRDWAASRKKKSR